MNAELPSGTPSNSFLYEYDVPCGITERSRSCVIEDPRFKTLAIMQTNAHKRSQSGPNCKVGSCNECIVGMADMTAE